jgi:hypothetical protein
MGPMKVQQKGSYSAILAICLPFLTKKGHILPRKLFDPSFCSEDHLFYIHYTSLMTGSAQE